MKFKFVLILCCVFIAKILCAQQSIPSQFIYDTLYSSILKEERRLVIHIPEGAKFNQNRYPVMFVLDAETQFTKSLGVLDHLSNTVGNEKCPQMIVVGLFHANRIKDLVPTFNDNSTKTPDLFPEFLEKELIPFIDKKYPTHPYRLFMGHSLGGLRVVNTMLYQTHLFQSYIALDPSLGHERAWINKGLEMLNQIDLSNTSLYISMGHTMPIGMDTNSIALDTSGYSRHMRCIMNFAKHAQQLQKSNFEFNWKYYPEYSHGAVAFYGMHDGLVQNFKWFVNEKLYDIFKPETSVDSSVKIITDYYTRISKKFAYENIPSEEGTSSLIDYLNYKKWYDKAYGFALLNTRNYPQSNRAKDQLETCRWNLKKSISELLPGKNIHFIYHLCKKESLKNEPEYNISEGALNTLGYDLMAMGKLKDASVIFKLNTEIYPNSANTYDSLGECLLKMNQTQYALAAYKKPLKLDPNNTNAIQVIKSHNKTN
ncbi:MAG: alpha/beta hydrolase-fold protein [Bacteroidia bacterium]